MSKSNGIRVVGTRRARRLTRRYLYEYEIRTVQDVHVGVEWEDVTCVRRRVVPTSVYVPHQGARECARRVANG